jgi:hypothetical protein
MSCCVGLGALVVLVALVVLARSCYLRQKAIYVTLCSLILLGTLSGVGSVYTWRMMFYEVGNLPIPGVEIMQC